MGTFGMQGYLTPEDVFNAEYIDSQYLTSKLICGGYAKIDEQNKIDRWVNREVYSNILDNELAVTILEYDHNRMAVHIAYIHDFAPRIDQIIRSDECARSYPSNNTQWEEELRERDSVRDRERDAKKKHIKNFQRVARERKINAT